MKKKVFVLTRYSVLSNKSARSWKIGQRSAEDYKELLFNSERLDMHEFLFFNLTFKSILEALKNTDLDVCHIIFISSELPDQYKKRLHDYFSKYSFCILKEVSPKEDLKESMRLAVDKQMADIQDDILYASIRLDDDDVLHKSYFVELEKYLMESFVGTAISFSNGYLGIYEAGKFVSFHKMHTINIAIGLATITKRYSTGVIEGKETIYHSIYSHSRTHWGMPVLVDGRKPMYIRTVHKHGDFYSKENTKKLSERELVCSNEVSSYFSLDSDLVFKKE